MRDEELAGLVRRIHQELAELERVLDRIQGGWELFRRSNDDLNLDGVALNLHGLYSGFERLFSLPTLLRPLMVTSPRGQSGTSCYWDK